MVLVVTSVIATTLGLELALRVYHGKVFNFESTLNARVRGVGRMQHDPHLGWAPKVGRVADDWTSEVEASGLRSTGRAVLSEARPILAIGDSFTFGDEVDDDETWVAHLEGRLNRRVLNGGVSAYGIDQAVLRAEQLLEQHRPEVIILSFVADDINRMEFDFLTYGGGWKPYFELVNGSLTLRNVPVPQSPRPPRFTALRRALGHSHLASFVFTRTGSRWWRNIPVVKRVHSQGEAVSVALMARLDSVAKSRKIDVVIVAMPSNGLGDGTDRLRRVTEGTRSRVSHVLDLTTETAHLTPDSLKRLFQGGGHYTPAVHVVVAERIASFLQARELVAPAAGRITDR